MAADMDVKQRFFPHTQDELKEIASDILRSREGTRWNRRGHGNLRGRRAFRQRAARRSRDDRAQPRQDGRRDGVHRQEAGQRQHGGLFPRGAEGYRRGRVQHRALHGGGHRGRPRRSRTARKVAAAISISTIRGTSTPRKPSKSRAARKPPRSTSTRASRIRKARASRRSTRSSCSPRRAAFSRAIRTRATTSRARRSPAAAATCSATTGTRRGATPLIWPNPKPSDAMRHSARSRAWARAASTRASAACCSRRRSRPAFSARSCRR